MALGSEQGETEISATAGPHHGDIQTQISKVFCCCFSQDWVSL